MSYPRPKSQFFRRKRLLFWGALLCVFFLPLTGWVLNRLVHRLPFPDHEKEVPQAWLKREKWLNEGRKSPDGLPAAAHWLKALGQAKNLPVVRSGFAPRPLKARPAPGLPFAPPPAGSCDWTEQGPSPLVDSTYGNVSGRVTDLVLDLTSDPTGNTLYLAAAYGGVWKTTNGLAASPSFTPISDIHQSLAMGAIGVDASVSPPILYVGTGEINQAGDSYYGTGILKSVDGGNTWTLTTTANSGAISMLGLGFSKILVDPTHPATVLAGAAFSICCDPGINQTNMGLYVSTDAGASWTHQATIGSHSCTDLVYDPSNQTYYAGIRGVGVYKSVDHGITWTLCASPFVGGTAPTLSNFGRVSLAVRTGKLWALFTDNNTSDLSTPTLGQDTGIAESDDNGATWHPVAVPVVSGGSLVNAGFGAQGEYDQYLAAPPGSTALLAGGIDLWKANTVNGTSTSWTNLTNSYNFNPSSHPDQHAFAAVNATTWYMGNDGGVWSTSNAGGAINDLNNNLGTIQFISVSPDPSALNAFIGGAQDNGTSRGTGSLTWNEAFEGDGGYTDVNPSTLGQFYGEQFSVGLYRLDNFGSAFVTVVDSSTIPDTSAFYVPYQVVPGAGPTVVYGTSRVWKGPGTASLGAGWGPISANLAGNTGQYVTGLDEAPSNPNYVYAAFTDPFSGATSVFVTANNGGTWTNITAGLPPSLPVRGIAVDPTNPLKAYVGTQGFSLTSGSGHVFMTTNSGGAWTDITGSLPDAPVNAVLVDPLFPNDLYLGTDVGVFVTQNGGTSWSQLGTLLPESAVFQLKMSVTCPRVLTAATYGRGAWTICPLDNPVCINTPTNTPSLTPSPTSTLTPTSTPTLTPTFTTTYTPTVTPTFTPTFTSTLTPTNSPTFTPTPTTTLTPTLTPTATVPNTLPPVLWPNPVENGATPQLRVSFASVVHSLHIKVFTTSFRKVREWDTQEMPAGLRNLPLDARDSGGVNLANGLYYVMVEADTNRWILKWLILR